MSTVEVRLGISLGVPGSMQLGCQRDSCWEISNPLLNQMTTGNYDLMSVLPCPLNIPHWRGEHRTARKRADRAEARGYWARQFERAWHEDDIYAVNTSTPLRQGRAMAPGYQERQKFSPLPDYPCARHAVRTTGVFGRMRLPGDDIDSEVLVGYLTMIRAGELALVSQILGHADHLENEIMYLLFERALERESEADPECLVVYNRHDSGTDGLRFFKERLGFEEMPVEWLP